MRLLHWLGRRWTLVRHRSAVERAMDDEMRYHLEMETREGERRGLSPEAARREAMLAFGGVERFKEEAREARGAYFVDELRRDASFALRASARAPAFTTAVVLTLALGIGATTTVFTVVRAVLLRELPYDRPDRLVRAWAVNRERDETRGPLSVPDFEDWRVQGTRPGGPLERAAAFSTLPTGLALLDVGEPTRLRTAYVTPDFFSTMGIGAMAGRTIAPDEHAEGRNHVVVISEGLWRSRFNGDRAIVGRTVRLNDQPYTVVGVLPAEVRFPDEPEVWTPTTVVPATGIPRTRGVRWLQVVGRLRPGTTLEAAQADLASIARAAATEFGDTNAGWGDVAVTRLRDAIVGDARPKILLIFASVLLVLLLVCANVAALMVARSSLRAREFAVRLALGAGRGRLVRQLLTESVVLAVAGGALGVALAWWGAGAAGRMGAEWLPPTGPLRPDGAVLGFALVVSVLAGLAFGLVPAARSTGNLGATLREGGRGSSAGRRTNALRASLVTGQMALAVVLVAGAGLLAKSFARLTSVDAGFDVERTLAVKLTLPSSRYASWDTYLPAAQRMAERVRAVPGVASVAMIKDAPFSGAAGEPMTFEIPGRAPGGAEPIANVMPVSPGYFRTMGITLLAGRDLGPQDADTAAATAVVSETTARAYWPGRSPVGEELVLGARRLRVVGVVGDARYTRLDSAAVPAVYLPQHIFRRRIVTLVVRTAGDPARLLPAVRAAVREVEPQQPITRIEPLRAMVGSAASAPRVLATLVASFGALALLLASLGVYGLVSTIIGQRTGEIGVRMALGAQARDVAAWALRVGLAPAAVGLAIGALMALAVSGAMSAHLFEVSPRDPVVFAAVPVLLAASALVAAAVPTRRATRVSPARALRAD